MLVRGTAGVDWEYIDLWYDIVLKMQVYHNTLDRGDPFEYSAIVDLFITNSLLKFVVR